MARMVPWVMGTSYVFPVRLSVIVRVSRAIPEPSDFLACVAIGADSIEEASIVGRDARLSLHCTPKHRGTEMPERPSRNGHKCRPMCGLGAGWRTPRPFPGFVI